MVTGHLEVERKFDVDPHFVLPELAGLPGVSAVDGPVEHQLSAVYHDSSDLRLLRARVTLRRRTGGADAGWHLKLPAGSARRELHAPLGRAVRKPPAGFLAPVAGILRGSAPGPVAALETRRTATSTSWPPSGSCSPRPGPGPRTPPPRWAGCSRDGWPPSGRGPTGHRPAGSRRSAVPARTTWCGRRWPTSWPDSRRPTSC